MIYETNEKIKIIKVRALRFFGCCGIDCSFKTQNYKILLIIVCEMIRVE